MLVCRQAVTVIVLLHLAGPLASSFALVPIPPFLDLDGEFGKAGDKRVVIGSELVGVGARGQELESGDSNRLRSAQDRFSPSRLR